MDARQTGLISCYMMESFNVIVTLKTLTMRTNLEDETKKDLIRFDQKPPCLDLLGLLCHPM